MRPTIITPQDYIENDMVASESSETPTLKTPDTKEKMIEQFEFLEVLGEGSFAKVFKCIEKDSQRCYAAKEIVSHGDLHYEAAIEYEIQILKGLRHENIVSLHTSFISGGSFYLIMEFVNGGSLFDEVIGETVYSEKQACRIIRQVLQALQYLHSKRIVHRDIKPDNLLLQSSKNDSDVTVKITDFGLARRLPEDSDAIHCDPSGAPMFLAPETILEEPVGFPVDMWATGVILYLMLVGYPPFWSSSDEYLLLAILGGKYSMPSPYWDNISSSTKELVRKLIVHQPDGRLTATQALDHPALSDSVLGRKLSVEKETKRNFLAVVCGIKAMIKFKRANVKSASRRLSERGTDLKSPVHNNIQQHHELDPVFLC